MHHTCSFVCSLIYTVESRFSDLNCTSMELNTTGGRGGTNREYNNYVESMILERGGGGGGGLGLGWKVPGCVFYNA